ncbi:unnamed protein product [Paramecium pentaurelia]|uniref:FACT complex subunit n=1 Tax=Paramecium pentaurelia TaxID=43138 RepID=A0A8S1UMR4_9CILI|nr:unnamed protein product [Paramecium pentaurelia]
MDKKIIADVFQRHLEQLVSRLNDDIPAICILSGKEDGSIKPKTKALFVWLFGYDMIETVFLATKKQIFYLASDKKLQMMEETKQKLSGKFEVHFYKKMNDNRESFEKIRQKIGNVKLGMPTTEKQAGSLAAEWYEYKGWQQIVDATQLIGDVLAVKDDQEQGFIQQSSQLTTRLFKKLIKQIEDSIDVGTRITHQDLAKKVEQSLENDKQKVMKEIGLQDGLYDFAYTPIIQSGGNYQQVEGPNKDYLSSDVIIIQLGTQVNEYNTNCIRTLFINPTEIQKKLYNAILEVQNKIITSMTIGTSLNVVFKDSHQLLQQKLQELNLQNLQLPTSFGYGIGLELKESNLVINEKSTHVVAKGEVYFVNLVLENVPNGQKNITYTIQVGDVIVITNGAATITTTQIPKAYKQISYQLQEEDEPERKPAPVQTDKDKPIRARPRNQQIQIQRQNEKQRQIHQEKLAKDKQTELEQRLEQDQFVQNQQEVKALELDKLSCYQKPEQYPKELQKGQIYIDNYKCALLVPLLGTHIPFHVSCIKNVSKIDEGKMGSSIRINFFTSETTAGQIQFPKVDGETIFIKELQYRSKKSDRPQNLILQIKSLQKKVKTEQQVEREKQNVGDMEPLIVNKGGRKPIFKDLKVRPTFGSGKAAGVLEVHTNGFRYIHSNKEQLDIVFKNIKHYIYQSPEQDIIAALHFHLHSPIVLGKRKTHDVQFYCEVGGAVEHLEGRKKTNRNDEDEIEEEERLRMHRKKMAKEFEVFIKTIEELGAEYKISFEKPFRDLGFEGNWNRARLFLQPTRDTLMNVVESPFFILTLNEVEICCFERIIPGIKSFDLVFVFKNYDKPVLRIESIDIKDLEGVKNWLDRMNLLFFEVGQNLVWKNVLAQIQKDIPGFVQDGGWTNILAESEEEGDEEDDPEAGDSEFSPGESGDDGEDDSDFTEDDEDGDEDADADEDDDDDEDLSDVLDLNNISEQDDDDDAEDSDSDKHRRKGQAKGHSKPQPKTQNKPQPKPQPKPSGPPPRSTQPQKRQPPRK